MQREKRLQILIMDSKIKRSLLLFFCTFVCLFAFILLLVLCVFSFISCSRRQHANHQVAQVTQHKCKKKKNEK